MKKKILISTGGTGRHVIPATIFYEQLKDKFDVFLVTDKRGSRFLNLEKYKVTVINTPKLARNLFLLPLNLIVLFFLTIKSLFFLKKNKIKILITTGGYMSLPICIAAKIFSIKIYSFEPNMVLGRVNSIFLRYTEKIFCYSDKIINFPKKYLNKIVLINSLLRKEFYSVTTNDKNAINNEINLLIIGGSQGAELFDNRLKKLIISLSKKYKLNICQQIGLINKKKIEDFYNQNNISYQLFNFEENILKFISNTNLCITRAGASTLSELTYLNIPYLAIPYPFAKDDHQYQNALFYKNRNCCWILKQDELTDDTLENNLINIIQNKDDYLSKKNSMRNFSHKNTWNNTNEKLISVINEN